MLSILLPLLFRLKFYRNVLPFQGSTSVLVIYVTCFYVNFVLCVLILVTDLKGATILKQVAQRATIAHLRTSI